MGVVHGEIELAVDAALEKEAWQSLIERTYKADPAAFNHMLTKRSWPDLGSKRPVAIPTVLLQTYSGKGEDMSVSRLERYAQCPYAYFVDYVIGAQRREEGEASPLIWES